MSINNLFEGGYAKKAYLPIGKQFVCGKTELYIKKIQIMIHLKFI